jgi:multiple sugar transport system substrate-binding protein
MDKSINKVMGKMDVRKRFRLMLLALAAVLVIGGCGGGNGGGGTTAGNSGTSGTSGGDSTPSAPKTETVTLKMLTQEAAAPVFEEVFAEFMAQHEGIKIEIDSVPFDQLNTRAISASMAGNPYDLMEVNHVDTLAYIKGGVIQPIQSYVERDAVNYESLIFPALLEAGKYQNELYTIPYNTDTRVLAINKAMFAEAGLSAPKTQEEMLEVGKALTKDGKYGFVNAMLRHIYMPVYEQGVFLAARGGHFYEIDANGKAVATIDNDIMKEYFQFNLDLLDIMPKESLTMTEDEGRQMFASGSAGMYIFGPWEYTLIQDAAVDYELALIPAGPAGSSGSTSGGYQLAIGKGSKHADQAWEVLKFMTTDPEMMAKIGKLGLPTAPEAYNYAPFNEDKYAIFKEQLKTSSLPAPPVENYSEVVDKFNEYYEKVLFKNMSVEEAVKQAQVEVQKLLDRS